MRTGFLENSFLCGNLAWCHGDWGSGLGGFFGKCVAS